MKVVFAWFVLPRRKKAEQGTQDRNLAISTEEKDAVAQSRKIPSLLLETLGRLPP